MPPFVYHAHVEDLPQETRYGGTYKRTGMIMDQGLVSWVDLTDGFCSTLGEDGRPTHHHPFDQIIYQVRGEMTMMIGPDDWPLVPGDAIYIPRDVPHGSRVTNGPALIIEIFAPIRTDYLYFCEHQLTFGAPDRNEDGSREDERPRHAVPFSGSFAGKGGVRL